MSKAAPESGRWLLALPLAFALPFLFAASSTPRAESEGDRARPARDVQGTAQHGPQNVSAPPVALPWSGASVTAGDVVFSPTMDGWFKALDAKSGKPLWQFRAGSGIIGQAVGYQGRDGRQYVAVLSGVGGWAGAVVAGDLKEATTRDGTLLVFRLP